MSSCWRPLALAPAWRRPLALAPAWRRPLALAPAWRRPLALTPAWRRPLALTPAWRRPLARTSVRACRSHPCPGPPAGAGEASGEFPGDQSDHAGRAGHVGQAVSGEV